jgi:hypothetical protein
MPASGHPDIGQRKQKWPRLLEQLSPIFKWTAGGLQTVLSCPRRRWSLATNRLARWATRVAPQTSCYATMSNVGSVTRYFVDPAKFVFRSRGARDVTPGRLRERGTCFGPMIACLYPRAATPVVSGSCDRVGRQRCLQQAQKDRLDAQTGDRAQQPAQVLAGRAADGMQSAYSGDRDR